MIDAAYCKAHPAHAAVNEKGERTDRVSLFSPYVSEYMIPQLEELIDEYGVDGALHAPFWRGCAGR